MVGVPAFAFDIVNNSSTSPYVAHITYGDGTTEDVAFMNPSGFFAVIEETVGIVSVHAGLAGGVDTTAGSFTIDNLTIGETPATVDTDGDLVADLVDNCP